MTDVEVLAARLDKAARQATAIPQLSGDSHLTLDDAYAVQRAGIALRAARGEQVVGLKLGFTSEAKAQQMGVSDVIAGVLTDEMQVADGGSVELSRLIHPRIEPEIAFRLGPRIEVAPALEIIDSRYRDFVFSLEDVVADNASAARYVIGDWRPLADLDIRDLAVELWIDEQVAEAGSTAAILGDPMRAIDAANRMATRFELPFGDGSLLLAGAATAAHPLTHESTVVATVANCGDVSAKGTRDPGWVDNPIQSRHRDA